jgi:hypothetical protein
VQREGIAKTASATAAREDSVPASPQNFDRYDVPLVAGTHVTHASVSAAQFDAVRVIIDR